MNNLSTPTLLLNEEICKSNIRRLARKAEENGLDFKPHMKTHQSAEIGAWIKRAGAKAITVSSLKMARYFSDAGWRDIIVAFPAHPRWSAYIDQLSAQTNLGLLINNPVVAKTLGNKLSKGIKVYIEIDTGSGRSGLKSRQNEEIRHLIKTIGKFQKLKWAGFYSHPGHSYQSRSPQEIQEVHQSVVNQFKELRTDFESAENQLEICIGDTPCCSAGSSFDGIDSISPGNFVFYDVMQAEIGSCKISEIAVSVSCPVVDRYPERNELVIHGGAVHFSKEHIKWENTDCYGLVATAKKDRWQLNRPLPYLQSLSQEHGIIKCPSNSIEEYRVGDQLTVLPVHSCLTANLMGRYKLDEHRFIEQMPTHY